jgi:hypothetical protein
MVMTGCYNDTGLAVVHLLGRASCVKTVDVGELGAARLTRDRRGEYGEPGTFRLEVL